MYYNTLKKERKMKPIERLIAMVEGEILENKKKAKDDKKGEKNENNIR